MIKTRRYMLPLWAGLSAISAMAPVMAQIPPGNGLVDSIPLLPAMAIPAGLAAAYLLAKRRR